MARKSMHNATETVDVQLHHETEFAYRVSVTGDDKDGVWVPKSQVQLDRSSRHTYTLTGPEWLLLDKGLV